MRNEIPILHRPSVLLVAALIALFTSQAALGHCKGKHTDEDNWPTPDHCSPDPEPPPGDDPVLFSVTLVAGAEGMSPFVDTTTLPNCDGFTDGNLHALFPAGCGKVWVSDGSDTFELFPWALEVINRKNLMTVRISFTQDQNFVFGHPPENGTGYISDRFDAVIVPDAGGFTIVVDEVNKNLTKAKAPDKGKVVGTVSFGSIVYTLVDSSPF
jgi:hypothetical protein